MPITFVNAALLAGLAAVVLPPLIHLLTRRKFDVLPWGAMQFLDLGKRTRRRALLDELLLMALRMGLIALVALALAVPAETAGWLGGSHQSDRDVVVVVDGSASMGVGIPPQAAQAGIQNLLGELPSNDTVAVVRAGPQSRLIAPLTADRDLISTSLQSLPPPRGGCDGPGAIAIACELLSQSANSGKRIVIVTDGQRHGWADENSRLRLEVLASQKVAENIRIDYVNIAPDRNVDEPRWSLDSLRASRAVATVGQSLTLRSALRFHGKGAAPLPNVQLEVDGQPIGPVPVPGRGDEPATRPIQVRHAFTSPDSHLVSLRLQSAGRVDLAVDVLPTIPVLIVDGDERANPERRGAEFLRDALAPSRDPMPNFVARIIPIGDFRADLLTREMKGPATSPRVLVLADVARLASEQIVAIEQFVATGGGVLVAHGNRTDAEHVNRAWLRGGRGWLPASVGAMTGSGELNSAPQPITARFAHPALELFRTPIPGGLGDVRFPRYRTLTPGEVAAIAAVLTDDIPFLIEKRGQRGRVIQAAVPLDDSDRSNLVEMPAFAPFAHELIAYLAGGRETQANLAPGQLYRWTIPIELPAEGWQLGTPDGKTSPIRPNEARTIVVEPREPGAHSLMNPERKVTRYFVVADDPAEADLTPLDEPDKAMMHKALPGLRFVADEKEMLNDSERSAISTDLSWIAFCGAIILLAAELWLTRKRALNVGA